MEFAITLPLLVVFVVGIYDFSGAFNQKQKIEQAAQEGAIIAGAQPMSDIAASGSSNPASLQPVVTAIFNSLAGSGVLNHGSLSAAVPSTHASWLDVDLHNFRCSGGQLGDNLVIAINRGSVSGSGPATVVHHSDRHVPISLAVQ